jgi:GNAT superfamily N-acetyltransferase
VNSVEVRQAQKSDLPELTRPLGLAFRQDPVMMWLFPDEKLRVGSCPGCSTPSPDTTTWPQAGVKSRPRIRRWGPRRCGGLIRAMGAGFPSFTVNNEMERLHPEEPHWYLAVTGSDPDVRGKGFGHVLMQSQLDRVDAEHAPLIWSPATLKTCPTTVDSGSRSPVRSPCRTAARRCGRCGGRHADEGQLQE